MLYESYVDYYGKPLNSDQIKIQRDKSKIIRLYVSWRIIPKVYMKPVEMNQVLEGLECKPIKPNKEFKTITVLAHLKNTYFRANIGRKDRVEICICKEINGKYQLFRICNHKAEDGYTGLDAWRDLNKVQKIDIKSLPEELHRFRTCCPKPIDWLNPIYKGKIKSGITKADISSAYGYQLTKELPDLSQYKLVEGFVEPNEEYPFVFYLQSNNMAVYNEGSTYLWKDNRYAEAGRRGRLYDVEDNVSLCFKAKNYGLKEAIEKLYLGRKDNPVNKQIMNLSVGFLDQREYYSGQIVGWPIRAVIIYRCNQVILNICSKVIEAGGIPVLINTDSVSWIGEEWGITEEKGLGKFTLEYEEAKFVGVGPKCYQIQAGEETLTRYSGPHRKEYISILAFGDILKEDVLDYIKKLENQAMYSWDDTSLRFITRDGGLLQ